MVDDETHFSAAQFVEPLRTESACKTILTLWETVYTEFPSTSVLMMVHNSEIIL